MVGRDRWHRVAACAADAWSAPSVGLLGGVATAIRAQGRGLGKRVTATAISALVRDYGAAALMVDAGNVAAHALYRSLGMTYRSMRAAVPPPDIADRGKPRLGLARSPEL